MRKKARRKAGGDRQKTGFSMGTAVVKFSMQRQPRTDAPFVGLSA